MPTQPASPCPLHRASETPPQLAPEPTLDSNFESDPDPDFWRISLPIVLPQPLDVQPLRLCFHREWQPRPLHLHFINNQFSIEQEDPHAHTAPTPASPPAPAPSTAFLDHGSEVTTIDVEYDPLIIPTGRLGDLVRNRDAEEDASIPRRRRRRCLRSLCSHLLSLAVGWILGWAIFNKWKAPLVAQLGQRPIVGELAPWDDLRASVMSFQHAMSPLLYIHQVPVEDGDGEDGDGDGEDAHGTTEALWVPHVLGQLHSEVLIFLCGDTLYSSHVDEALLGFVCDDVLSVIGEASEILGRAHLRVNDANIKLKARTSVLLRTIATYRKNFAEWPFYACSRQATVDFISEVCRLTSDWPGDSVGDQHRHLMSLLADVLRRGLPSLLRVYSVIAQCPYQEGADEPLWMEDLCVSLKLMYAVHIPRLEHVVEIISSQQPHADDTDRWKTSFDQGVQDRMEKGYQISTETQDCLNETVAYTGNATRAQEIHILYWNRLFDEAETYLAPLHRFLHRAVHQRPIFGVPDDLRHHSSILQERRPHDVRLQRMREKAGRCRWFNFLYSEGPCWGTTEANKVIDDWAFTISPGCTVTTLTMTGEPVASDAFWDAPRRTEHHKGETISGAP